MLLPPNDPASWPTRIGLAFGKPGAGASRCRVPLQLSRNDSDPDGVPGLMSAPVFRHASDPPLPFWRPMHGGTFRLHANTVSYGG